MQQRSTTIEDREADRAVARACLARLDPNTTRDEWVRVGMALRSVGDDMLGDWHQWSSGSPQYRQREADRQWSSFNADGGKQVTLGTLIHAAGLGTEEVREIRRRHAPPLAASPPRQVIEPKAMLPKQTLPGFATIDELVAWVERRDGVQFVQGWAYSATWHQLRFADGEGGKQFRPATRDAAGQWHPKAPDDRHLYRVEQLPADAAELVLVVEGEKCADLTAALGFAVVTSSNGCKSAAKSDWTPLRGRRVAIVPDKDTQGREYADAVRAILQGLGCDVVVVELPGLADGEDIEQWAAARGDAAHDELVALVDDASTGGWQWPDAGEQLDALLTWCDSMQGRERVGMACGVFPVIDDMLDGWRGLALMSGAPGCGKTTLALGAAVGVLHTNPDALAVVLSCEMSPQELHNRMLQQHSSDTHPLTWHQLVKGTGIDPDDRQRRVGHAVAELEPVLQRLKVLSLSDVLRLGDQGTGDLFVALRVELKRLMRRTRTRQAFVVVDNFATLPVRAPEGTPWGSELDRDRQVIEGLLQLHEQTGFAVLTIVQMNKDALRSAGGEGARRLAAVKGSVEQTYAADIVAMIEHTNRMVPGRFDRFGNPLPVVRFTVDKGRDGMTRSACLLLHDYEHSKLREVSYADTCDAVPKSDALQAIEGTLP
jgi:replicative DNA helicase